MRVGDAQGERPRAARRGGRRRWHAERDRVDEVAVDQTTHAAAETQAGKAVRIVLVAQRVAAGDCQRPHRHRERAVHDGEVVVGRVVAAAAADGGRDRIR